MQPALASRAAIGLQHCLFCNTRNSFQPLWTKSWTDSHSAGAFGSKIHRKVFKRTKQIRQRQELGFYSWILRGLKASIARDGAWGIFRNTYGKCHPGVASPMPHTAICSKSLYQFLSETLIKNIWVEHLNTCDRLTTFLASAERDQPPPVKSLLACDLSLGVFAHWQTDDVHGWEGRSIISPQASPYNQPTSILCLPIYAQSRIYTKTLSLRTFAWQRGIMGSAMQGLKSMLLNETWAKGNL